MFCGLILLYLLFIAPPVADGKTYQQAIEEAEFCSIAINMEIYKSKMVQIRVVLYVNFENSYIFDKKCKNIYADIIPNCNEEGSCKKMRQKLQEGLRGSIFSGVKANVVLVGKFLDKKLHEQKYGGPPRYDMAFEVEEVIQSLPPDP